MTPQRHPARAADYAEGITGLIVADIGSSVRSRSARPKNSIIQKNPLFAKEIRQTLAKQCTGCFGGISPLLSETSAVVGVGLGWTLKARPSGCAFRHVIGKITA